MKSKSKWTIKSPLAFVFSLELSLYESLYAPDLGCRGQNGVQSGATSSGDRPSDAADSRPSTLLQQHGYQPHIIRCKI